MRSAALVTMAYGRALLATGSADDYVAHIEEAQTLLSEQYNPSVEAMLAAVLSHAVYQAGFLQRSLALNEAALKCVDRIEPADQRMLGFNPKYWLWALRARYLLLTGDTSGAKQQLEKLLRHLGECRQPSIAPSPWEYRSTQRRSTGMRQAPWTRPGDWTKRAARRMRIASTFRY